MSSGSQRLVLIGVGPTTATALDGLADEFEVVALLRDTLDDVTKQAEAAGIRFVTETSLAAIRRIVQQERPDAVVVSSYDRILPPDVLHHCPFVNVHYAPLPRYRGRANVNWAIINGEPDAYISIHSLEPDLDAGGILYQGRVPIGARDTVADVYRELNALQRDAIARAVRRRLAGDRGEPQDESAASYGCTRLPEDGEISWAGSTAAADRLVRALAPPYPGAYTFLGPRRLRVLRAEVRSDAPRYEGRIPGRPVGRSPADGWVDVLTGDGVLRLHLVQFDGDEIRPAAEVIRSVKQTLGLNVQDLLARITALEARLQTDPTNE
jgi:methionyl-tRNA formyltransferase